MKFDIEVKIKNKTHTAKVFMPFTTKTAHIQIPLKNSETIDIKISRED